MASPSDPSRDPVWDTAWERAFELAGRGLGRVSPNPPVGAVILRGDRIIGEGWHTAYGKAHAEREAIADAESRGEDVAGATMLVTLEPCGHEGRQPPCAHLLVEKELARVVYGCEDPSEKTAGVGPELLQRSGIETSIAEGEIVDRARWLTRGFRKHCATGRPLLLLKMAISLDGRVAGPDGRPVRLTGPETDRLVHRWRSEFDAIAIGSGTLASDDPRLTARELSDPVQPTRVVFLGSGEKPKGTEAVFADLPEAPLLFVLSGDDGRSGVAQREADRLEALGASVLVTESGAPLERFGEALDGIAANGLRTVLLEGGPRLAATALLAGEVDEIELFVAPVLLGRGPGAFDPLVERDGRPFDPGAMAVSTSGPDIRLSRVLREW